jgi:hypothetical protein
VILLSAIVAGLLVGMLVSWRTKTTWQPPTFKYGWLVVAGFLPQFLAFFLPTTQSTFPDWLASVSLVGSQVILLVFCLLNRNLPGIFLINIGLGLNLIVILANGGFMPLPIETAAYFVPQEALAKIESGSRIATGSKDILLPTSEIILPWLSDRFFMPFSKFVYSFGDVMIAIGAFWLLVASALSAKPFKEEYHA